MTRKQRTRKNLEQKIVSLQIKLSKRQTTKLSRRINLKQRIEFYKKQLQERIDADSVSNAAAGTSNDSVTSLSTQSSND